MAAAILRRKTISFISDSTASSHFSFSLYFSTQRAKPPPLEVHTVAKFLIDDHHFSPDAAARIASSLSLTSLESQRNADSILTYLKRTGFSNPQLERIVKSFPRLLSRRLGATIEPKLKVLRAEGFTSDEIVELIARQPGVLSHSPARIRSSLTVLKRVLGSTAAAAKFMKVGGEYICDMEATFIPNVKFLKSCGVPMGNIVAISSQSLLLQHKPENLRKFVERADAMGLDRGLMSFVHGVRVIGSMTSESWEAKTETLRSSLGFSEEDVIQAFRNSPKAFSSSSEKMRRVAEAVIGTRRYDTSSLVAWPQVFQYDVERRLKPRFRVLRALEEEELIGKWPSLARLSALSDEKFFEKFVAPFLDHVGELWIADAVSRKVESLKKM